MSDLKNLKKIGRYRLDQLIGSGGMGYVFAAYDTALEREVALKIIRKDLFSEQEYVQIKRRFLREARNLARLNHPNIVKVYDVGQFEDTPFMVMELIYGQTLRAYMQEPMPYQVALKKIIPVAEALGYLHRQELVHRDVKPTNVIIRADDHAPVLTDFGISKNIDTDPDATSLTDTGSGIGTPNYISPEQVQGLPLDGRADQYSLAAVLYECITGKKLFEGDSPMSIAMRHCSDPIPRAKDTISDLPDEVDEILATALAKNPENRFPDMKTFAASLKKLLTEADNLQEGMISDEATISMSTPNFPEDTKADTQISEPIKQESCNVQSETDSFDDSLPTIVISRDPEQQKEPDPKKKGIGIGAISKSKTATLYIATLIVALSIIFILLFYILKRPTAEPGKYTAIPTITRPAMTQPAETEEPLYDSIGTATAEIIAATETYNLEATEMILQYETEKPKNVYVLTDVNFPYLLRTYSEEESRFIPDYSIPSFTNGDKVIFTGKYKNGLDENGAETMWMSVRTWNGTEGWLKSNILKPWDGQ